MLKLLRELSTFYELKENVQGGANRHSVFSD